MVRVIVVDDHDGFRAALESVLRATVDLRVVGSASNAQEASRWRRGWCRTWSSSGSRALMRDAVAAGAALTLLKDADPADLIAGIRTLAGAGL